MRTHRVDKLLEQHCYKSAAALLQLKQHCYKSAAALLQLKQHCYKSAAGLLQLSCNKAAADL